MSFNRTAARVAPALLRGGTRHIRPSRSLPNTVPAIAILLPRRGLATDTSTQNTPGVNAPPPGFNIKDAQKPLSKEQRQQEAQTASEELKDQVSVPKDGPTAQAKTKAVESQSLAELAAEKAAADKSEDKKLAKKKEGEKNLTLWQKVKREAAHYWDGTKLLGVEVRISSKLALKMAAGYELTRREHRQVRLTIHEYSRPRTMPVILMLCTSVERFKDYGELSPKSLESLICLL
jgi:LETM1 and EF-hand domain-containing protein 1